jgi:hypothetical protein
MTAPPLPNPATLVRKQAKKVEAAKKTKGAMCRHNSVFCLARTHAHTCVLVGRSMDWDAPMDEWGEQCMRWHDSLLVSCTHTVDVRL